MTGFRRQMMRGVVSSLVVLTVVDRVILRKGRGRANAHLLRFSIDRGS